MTAAGLVHSPLLRLVSYQHGRVRLSLPTETENGEVVYLARKLTPTECASLQGFEKDWCALVPHKDSAEYKMWGNGMAFPCMLYIMEGVQEVLTERYLKNLFGGDTSDR